MAVAKADVTLLEALEQSAARVSELELTPDTEKWLSEAEGLLRSAHGAFAELVAAEDVEEDEAHEALDDLRAARSELNQAFEDLLAALDIGLGERRLGPPREAEAVAHETQLAHYLNRFHGGEYASLRDNMARTVIEHGVGFVSEFVSEAHRERVEREVREALDHLEGAKERAASEGAEAVAAFGELVSGRSIARVCYLTARDLVSAALRFEGRHAELDDVVAPLADVTAIGFG